MRKLLIILLAASLLAALPACRRRDQPREERPSESVSDIEQEEQPGPSEPEPQSSAQEEQADTAGAEQAVRDLCEALQSGNRDSIKAQIDYDNLLQLQEGQGDESFLALLQYLKYEIVSAEGEDKLVTVKTRLTSIDMHNVLMPYIKQCMELEYENALSEAPLEPAQLEAKYSALFQAQLEQNMANTLVRTVDIQVVYSAGSWRVQLGEALRTAVLGDYFSANEEVQRMARGG